MLLEIISLLWRKYLGEKEKERLLKLFSKSNLMQQNSLLN